MNFTIAMSPNILFIILLHLALLYSISEESPMHGDTIQLVENDEFKKDFAFMGSIGDFSRFGVHRKFENHKCGCVLISKRHVLTAAHCLEIVSYQATMVTFGSTELNRGLSYEIKAWINYKTWAIENRQPYSDILHYDDVGIIKLSSDVRGIKPAVITKLHDRDIIGKKVLTIGWGYADTELTTRPSLLQKAYSRVLNTTDCEIKILRLYGPGDTVHPNEYCTMTNPPVILGCGDSGGPLLLNGTNEVIGINSAVCDGDRPEKTTQSISMHTKVRLYKKFINSVLSCDKL